jgi:hypothetical protein
MVFLYYLLLLYGGVKTIEVYSGNEKLFNQLSNENLIYVIMLSITVITVHSGVTYILKNKHLIKKLFNETNKLV